MKSSNIYNHKSPKISIKLNFKQLTEIIINSNPEISNGIYCIHVNKDIENTEDTIECIHEHCRQVEMSMNETYYSESNYDTNDTYLSDVSDVSLCEKSVCINCNAQSEL